MEWYHCGRCGSLFQSPAGDADERVCAKCGRDPSLGVEATPSRSQAALPKAAPNRLSDAEDPRERRESRRTTRNSTVATVGLGWAGFMALTVIVVKFLWPEQQRENTPDDWIATVRKGNEGGATMVKLEQAMPSCVKTLSSFLTASTPAARNQFVNEPMAAAGRMARFYALNSLPRVDPETLENAGYSLLKVPGYQALESRWQGPDGLLLDCVFVQQGDEWLLDWDHFVRYQEFPWTLFTTGEGPAEAEFRLLVRQRATRYEVQASEMNLVFFLPQFGRPKERGKSVVELRIGRKSDAGRLLTAGFKQRAAGESSFGSTLKPLEDEDMLRVRVRLRRIAPKEGDDGGTTFELVKVEACHWLNSNDPGVKPEPP